MEGHRTNEHTESTPLINTEILAAELDKPQGDTPEQTDLGQFDPDSGDPFRVVNALKDWDNACWDLLHLAAMAMEGIENYAKPNIPRYKLSPIYGFISSFERIMHDLGGIIEMATSEAKNQYHGNIETDLEPFTPGSLSPITSMEDWMARHCGNVALFQRVCSDLWDHLPSEGPLTDAVFALRESFTEQADELKKLVNGRGPVQ